MVTPSSFLVYGFILIAVVLAAGFVAAIAWTERRAWVAGAGTAAWLAATGGAAHAGLLSFDGRPPTMILLLAIMFAGVAWLSRTSVVGRMAETLPLALLVGWQGFRLPLELLMHRAHQEGLMPEQMSYSGLNFDIVTGGSALLVAGLIASGRATRGLVWGWNLLGSVLLLNIVIIAILSAPTPLRLFSTEPANVWVTTFPFVWLPAVMVATALLGHLLIFRRLRGWSGEAAADDRLSGRAGPVPGG